MNEHVTLKELADEWGLDKSNARKYVLAHGLSPVKIRDPRSRQLVLAFSPEDANTLKQIREAEGYTRKDKIVESDKGYFYIIQVIPELDPLRVKLGFASNINSRLQAHKTSAPTAVLAESWPCMRQWEPIVITSITRIGCTLIANEVYTCDDLEALKERARAFFSLMPEL